MKTIMFAGQGAQFKGMGKTLFSAYPKQTQQASNILGYSIEELCVEDAEKKLHQTQYTQPALYVVNALLWEKEKETEKNPVSFFVGHSLGEYNALLAAEAFNFETGLKLVQKRGELRNLGTNSIDRADILMQTMEELQVKIPMIEFAAAQNIGEIVRVFEQGGGESK